MPFGIHSKGSHKAPEAGNNPAPVKPANNAPSKPADNKTQNLTHTMLVNQAKEDFKTISYHRAEQAKCEKQLAVHENNIANLNSQKEAAVASKNASLDKIERAKAILAKRQAEREAAANNQPPQTPQIKV